MAKAPTKEKKPEAEAEGEGEAQQPKKKGKLPLILALVAVLAVGGGGAAWFFLSKGKGAEAPHEAKAEPLKPPVFVQIENFTVNLTAEGAEQYLQVSATLKVLDAHAGDAVKLYMPEVRHRILLLLSAKKGSEINSVEGRERLAEEIRVTTNNILLVAAGKAPRPLPGQQNGSASARAEGKIAPAPAHDASEKPAPEAKPEGGEEAKAPEEAAKPQGEQAAAPPASAPSRAAPEDPVQSVFFTSFIIQ